MMWGNGYDMGWGIWMVMGVGTTVFWAVVVLLVCSLLAGRNPSRYAAAARPEPLTHLKEGLARGEVTPEEYEQHGRLITHGH